MQNRKQIERDIHLIGSFKGLAQAYEEISVMKMQRIRGKVLSAREFLDELSNVFADVKSSYASEIERLLAHKNKPFSFKTHNKNGKTVSVLLSSNNKLYGDIGKKVFHLFVDSTKAENSDIYLIGEVGRELYEGTSEKKKYAYIPFPEGKGANDSMNEVLKVLENYETVNVYYGKFVNVITQDPVRANVSGTQGLEPENEKRRHVKFFFEPSLESVLTIFENEIFRSLFKQTLHESELSLVTSRIRQMESALENIDVSQKKLNKKRRLVIKRIESAKRLQRLSGIALWR